MVGQKVLNAYRTTEKQAEIHPVKLIHMLFERVLVHLELAEEGIREKSPKKRGENLGKAIAIITELQASIKSEDHSEAAKFLRGMYGAIMFELPKISVSQDVKILRQAHTYLARLKQVWEETAMKESGEELIPVKNKGNGIAPRIDRREDSKSFQTHVAVGGLSVSI